MLSLGMDWMPWIVVGTVAFCNRGEPTRRVIALVPGGEGPQFATGSPATARGRATRPAVVSVLAARVSSPRVCDPFLQGLAGELGNGLAFSAATAAARSRRVAATRNAICGEVAVPDAVLG